MMMLTCDYDDCDGDCEYDGEYGGECAGDGDGDWVTMMVMMTWGVGVEYWAGCWVLGWAGLVYVHSASTRVLGLETGAPVRGAAPTKAARPPLLYVNSICERPAAARRARLCWRLRDHAHAPKNDDRAPCLPCPF